jgi:hypothetical protein
MINVIIGINKVYATLTERVTVASPFYLLNLIKIGDNTKKLALVDDLSPLDRVNTLVLELVTDINLEDLSNGLVYLDAGDYKYEFYQSEDEILDLTGKKLLESGLLTYNPIIISDQYNTTNTEKVYGE